MAALAIRFIRAFHLDSILFRRRTPAAHLLRALIGQPPSRGYPPVHTEGKYPSANCQSVILLLNKAPFQFPPWLAGDQLSAIAVSSTNAAQTVCNRTIAKTSGRPRGIMALVSGAPRGVPLLDFRCNGRFTARWPSRDGGHPLQHCAGVIGGTGKMKRSIETCRIMGIRAITRSLKANGSRAARGNAERSVHGAARGPSAAVCFVIAAIFLALFSIAPVPAFAQIIQIRTPADLDKIRDDLSMQRNRSFAAWTPLATSPPWICPKASS